MGKFWKKFFFHGLSSKVGFILIRPRRTRFSGLETSQNSRWRDISTHFWPFSWKQPKTIKLATYLAKSSYLRSNSRGNPRHSLNEHTWGYNICKNCDVIFWFAFLNQRNVTTTLALLSSKTHNLLSEMVNNGRTEETETSFCTVFHALLGELWVIIVGCCVGMLSANQCDIAFYRPLNH